MKIGLREFLVISGLVFTRWAIAQPAPQPGSIPSANPLSTPAAPAPTPPANPKLAPEHPSGVPSRKPTPPRTRWVTVTTAMTAHKTATVVMAWLLGFPLLWTLLLLFAPVALVSVLRMSGVTEFTLWGLKFRALEYAILLTPFVFRGRVLDAWVARHVEHAREYFARRENQKGRELWIELPVKVEDKIISELSSEKLKPFFRRPQVQILIHGEGGVGKTSLACQIARWAMDRKPNARLQKHLMLPLLFDSDFVQSATATNVMDPLGKELERISGRSTKEIPERFQTALFSRGRLLVIIDSLSERSAPLREFLTAQAGTDPFQCTIFTSRTEEKQVLGQVALTRMQPFRLQGDNLTLFMRAYLKAIDPKVRFSEREVMALCEGLSDVAGDRDITALLATIYGRTAVRRKKGEAGPEDPQTIPDLMFGYVRQICDRTQVSSIDEVQGALQRISWECLRDDFRPRPISRERAIAAASGKSTDLTADEKNAARLRVDQLEKQLKLLQSVGAGASEVKVGLDPLAEYMAAAYLVRRADPDGSKWKTFLEDIDTVLKSNKPAEIRGFLLAVRDSLPVPPHVPAWLEGALLDRAQYDLRSQAESRRERRLRFFLFRLKEGDPAEKLAAIENIERGGYLDADAESALVDVTMDADAQVRAAAIYSLGQLNAHGPQVRDALSRCLKDTDERVRWRALYSYRLASPDPDQQAAAVLPLADDPAPLVRDGVALVLGLTGSTGGITVLRRLALDDADNSVRAKAASSWVRIAPGADSLCALTETLDQASDWQDYELEEYAKLIETWPAAMECLARQLSNPSPKVRVVSLRLLVEFEKAPPEGIREIVRALLRDEDADVKVWAAIGLHNWDWAKDEVVSVLKGLSRSGHAGTRATALGLIGKAAIDLAGREVLHVGLSDSDGGVRVMAAAALYAAEPSDSAAEKVIWDTAKTGSEASRLRLAASLRSGAMKTLRGAKINDLIRQLMADALPQVRKEIAETIIERNDADLLPVLLSRSNDPSDDILKLVAKAFGLMTGEGDRDLSIVRRLLQHPKFEVQLEAARSYWKVTRKSGEILPVLYQFQSAEWPWLRQYAFDLVTEMAKAGQADLGLIELGLKDRSEYTRHSAIKALVASGIENPVTTNKVLELTDDPSNWVRDEAMEYLVRAGVSTEAVRKALLGSIQQEQGLLKRGALEQLGELGGLTEPDIETVLAATTDPDEEVKTAALEALLNAGVPAPRVLSRLAPLLADRQPLQWFRILRALGRRGRYGITDFLTECAKPAQDNRNSKIRSLLLEIVRDFGDVPESAIPSLAGFISDPDGSVVRQAADLIAGSATADPVALRALAEAARSSDRVLAAAALPAYERLAPGDSETRKAAVAMLQDQSPRTRFTAAAVLSKTADVAAQSMLRDALSGTDVAQQTEALQALSRLPGSADRFQVEIEPLLSSSDPAVSRTAAEALIGGQFAERAVAAVVSQLGERPYLSTLLRKAKKKAVSAISSLQQAAELGSADALKALCEIAPREIAQQSLRTALRHRNAGLRAAAAAAAMEMAVDDGEVRDALQRLSHDADRNVRLAARKAIAALEQRAQVGASG